MQDLILPVVFWGGGPCAIESWLLIRDGGFSHWPSSTPREGASRYLRMRAVPSA
jgi:hypothetical protein